MKKTIAKIMLAVMLFTTTACSVNPNGTKKFPKGKYQYKYQWYATMTPEEIVGTLTLEQKAAQMVQPILYKTQADESKPMSVNCYGSIYGDEGMLTAEQWRKTLDEFQKEAIESEAGIPYIVAQDDVHGVGYCVDGVYFPHNIGQGAANDEELAYQVGKITADESRMCHMLWNLYPCVAQSNDPRWGRNYECYGSDLEQIKKLSTAYTKGLIDGGVVATAKHFFGDGNVKYDTGERSDFTRLIDRGDAQLTDAEIKELLKVYQAQIDAGVQAIMVSYSSLNGKKMHENAEYIGKLRTEMGFKGLIMSDSMAVQNTSPKTFEEQVITAVNCGIDLLMEGLKYDEVRQIIIKAVKEGKITEARVNEAATRVIKLKKDIGLFEDPLCEKLTTVQKEPGTMEYRAVAEKLVEKSLVLLKNDNNTLPFKQGTKVYITGPNADNTRAQCGGWTMGWKESHTSDIVGVTTIKEAFERYAKDYGIEVITDPKEAEKADVVLLCVGEDAYAEWYGDLSDIDLRGVGMGMYNSEAIDSARALKKPVVACIIAGRHLAMSTDDFNNWDSVVMCYLPGSEGKGISDVLCGCSNFSGKIPEPWYNATRKIGTDDQFFKTGYGLTYPEGFTPRQEPEAVKDIPTPKDSLANPMEGTNYTKGVYTKDGRYSNEYAGIKLQVPATYEYHEASDDTGVNREDVENALSDKHRAFALATNSESYFSGKNEYIQIVFINTKKAVPDDPDYTEQKYINDFKEMTEYELKQIGLKAVFGDQSKVTLSGKEYVKIQFTVEGQTVYLYVSKLDDSLMTVITASSMAGGSADKYEKMFG